MAHKFCDHLDEYGVQYTRTEASYQQCVNLLERIMADGEQAALSALVVQAVQDWTDEDVKLREMLVEQVQAGTIRLPANLHLALKQGKHPVCAECNFAVPRLEYPEWALAANGEASFQGHELEFSEPLPV